MKNKKILAYLVGAIFGLIIFVPSLYALELELSKKDMGGGDLTNVGKITGDGTYISFGGEVTSHSLNDDGDAVFHAIECNEDSYFDEKVSCSKAIYFTSTLGKIYAGAAASNQPWQIDSCEDGAFWRRCIYTYNGDMTLGEANNTVTIDTHTHVTGNLTVDGEIIGGTKSYGEMYRNGYAVATTIDTADVWHMVSTTTVGALNNWTHDVGDTGAITVYADATGGKVWVTSAGHGMSAGDMISITGSTNYNALEELVTVHTDSFTVTATWAGDDGASTWIKGSSLTAGANSAGTYQLSWSATLTPQTNAHVFTFAMAKNAVACEKCRARSKLGTAGDYASLSGTAIFTIAAGDILNFIIKNVGANGNVTIRHGNVNLHRL